MSPHSIDDDGSGRAQKQGGHDDNGGQDDEDNGPDIQDVLGKQDIHRGLADSIHVGPQIRSRSPIRLFKRQPVFSWVPRIAGDPAASSDPSSGASGPLAPGTCSGSKPGSAQERPGCVLSTPRAAAAAAAHG